jgi:hypothetical protein
MAKRFVDRAKMTVASAPGTGAISLGAAVAGYQTLAAAGMQNGDTTSYVIEDGSNWEVGLATYSTTGPTLTRTTVYASSNSGAAISASSAALVFAAALAEDLAAFLTAITSALVTAALGFTPYNSSNPAGYITGDTTTFGAVGTYVVGYYPGGSVSLGATIAGSSLETYPFYSGSGQALSGTWRCMGWASANSTTSCLWVRIS